MAGTHTKPTRPATPHVALRLHTRPARSVTSCCGSLKVRGVEVFAVHALHGLMMCLGAGFRNKDVETPAIVLNKRRQQRCARGRDVMPVFYFSCYCLFVLLFAVLAFCDTDAMHRAQQELAQDSDINDFKSGKRMWSRTSSSPTCGSCTTQGRILHYVR